MSNFADALPPRAVWPAAGGTTGMLRPITSAINKKGVLYFIEFNLCGRFGVSGEEALRTKCEVIIAPHTYDLRSIVYAQGIDHHEIVYTQIETG
jgi:hypothetical protein